MCIYILFHIIFHCALLEDTEYSSLCYMVEPCCLSILYIVVCISSPQTPDLFPALPPISALLLLSSLLSHVQLSVTP